MLGTVRTSRCNASEKRLDDRSRNRERERFDELAFVPDGDSAMMRRECGHDVLTFQFAADDCPKRAVKSNDQYSRRSLFFHCRAEKVEAEEDGAP